MVQPASKRLVTESTVGGHVATQISTPGTATATALNASIGDQVVGSVQRSRRALAPWFTRTAKRSFDTRPMCIWVMSHSIGEGSGSSAWSRRWVSQLATALPSVFPVTGVTEASQYYPAHHASVAVTGRWTYDWYTGTTALDPVFVDNIYGWGGRSVQLASRGRMNLDPALLTGKTKARIFYPTGPNKAQISVYIDGALAVAITPSTTDGEAFQDVALSGANTSFDMRHVNVSNSIHVNGVILYKDNDTKGVSVIDASHAGWSSRDYLLNQVTNRTTAAQLANKISSTVPGLVIVGLLANDYGQGVPPAETKANLKALLASVRSSAAVASSPASFLLLTDAKPDAPGAELYPWADYVKVHEEIAAEDVGGAGGTSATAVLDLNLTFPEPSVAVTLGMLTSDLVHPTDAGHALTADLVRQAITP